MTRTPMCMRTIKTAAYRRTPSSANSPPPRRGVSPYPVPGLITGGKGAFFVPAAHGKAISTVPRGRNHPRHFRAPLQAWEANCPSSTKPVAAALRRTSPVSAQSLTTPAFRAAHGLATINARLFPIPTSAAINV